MFGKLVTRDESVEHICEGDDQKMCVSVRSVKGRLQSRSADIHVADGTENGGDCGHKNFVMCVSSLKAHTSTKARPIGREQRCKN